MTYTDDICRALLLCDMYEQNSEKERLNRLFVNNFGKNFKESLNPMGLLK